ncbi:MAG: PAS domain S-box protein [Bacteroidetes bacterium]|nr:MAG: PAS domain S-box protein [Bacteroidota bacterium]
MSNNLDIPNESRGFSGNGQENNTQTELKYAQILEGCVDCVITIDELGTIQFFNASSEKMWGYSRQEVLGKNVKMLMGADHATNHDTYLQNYHQTHIAKVIGIGRELDAQTKDGRRIPILLTLSEAKTETSSIFTAFIKDLTSQKALETRNQQQLEEIRANEEELRQNMEELLATQEVMAKKQTEIEEIAHKFTQILEGCADSVIIIDDKGTISFFNQTAERMWGYSREEMIGKNVKVLMPQERAIEHDTYLHNYKQTHQAKVIGKGREETAQRKDGSKFPILLTISEAKIATGSVFTAFIKDISDEVEMRMRSKQQMEELQATEEEMRQNMEELQATQERQHQLTLQLQKAQAETQAQFRAINAAYAFIEFDVEGYVINANPIFLDAMGYLLSEIQGRHHRLFVTQEYAQSTAYQDFWADLRNGRSRTELFQRVARGGNIVWLDASYTPVFDEDGKVIKVIKLAKNVTNFTQALKATATFLEELKNGNFEAQLDLPTNQLQGDIAQMAQANLLLRDTLKGILAEINRVARLAGKEGKLSERLQIAEQKGAWQEVINALNQLLQNIAEPILEVQEVITRLSMGDLTTNYVGKAQGDIADMAKALNVAIQSLNQLVSRISQNAQVVAQYAQNLTQKATAMRYTTTDASTAIQQMADGAQDQASRTDEASRLVEKTLSASLMVHQKADTINQSAEKNGKNCQDGLQAVGQLVRNMGDIAESVGVTSNAIEILTNRSEEISRILNLINEIAFQTNLLALNAKIEAARAGEAGRGFGVVADEIGKLADDARRSTVDIDKLIKDVQKDINTSAKAIDKMKDSVKSGESVTANTTKIFEEINTSGQATLTLSQAIVTSALEQKESINAVVKNIEKIVVVAEETASGTQQVANSAREMDKAMLETSQTAEQLLQIAEELKKQVGQFKS